MACQIYCILPPQQIKKQQGLFGYLILFEAIIVEKIIHFILFKNLQ